MIELRFCTNLYSTVAIDAAVEVYEPFANIERESQEDAQVIRITAKDEQDEQSLAGELANFVLGATVDGAGSTMETDIAEGVS